MGEKVQEWLLGVITGDKSRIIWAIVIVLFFLAVIVYPYIDANFLYYDRIEKRIDNLQRLIALSGETLEDNDDLRAEYCSILGEIEEARAKTLSSATAAKDSTEEKQLKFIGGALLFAIVGVYMIFQHKKGEKFTIKKVYIQQHPCCHLVRFDSHSFGSHLYPFPYSRICMD